MYKIMKSGLVCRVDDNMYFIPERNGNAQEMYNNWLAAGGVPAREEDEVIVPHQITRAQGKMALIAAGLWPSITAFIETIENPIEKAMAEVALNDTAIYRRDSPFLNDMADKLGLTSEQLDELFIAAEKFNP